jgi:hypothetical protein
VEDLDLEPIIERSKDLTRICVWFPEPMKTQLEQFVTDEESLIQEVIKLRGLVDHLQNWCAAPED